MARNKMLRVFFLSAMLGVLSALFSPIPDCDEVFNFWEPLHFWLFGRGFKTWEYDPEYGLRSWLYVILHSAPLALLQDHLSKENLFYALRVILAVCAAASTAVFYQGVQMLCGANVAFTAYHLLAFSPGVFAASVTFLPTTFSMCCVLLCTGLWMQQRSHNDLRHLTPITFFAACLVFLGWPFAGLCLLPIILDFLYHLVMGRMGFMRLTNAVFVLVLVLGATAAVDTQFYGRYISSFVKIVEYNVLREGGSGSSQLYGVEEWHYFFRNLVLNFNVAFVASLAGLAIFPLAVLKALLSGSKADSPSRQFVKGFLFTSPFWVWFLFWLLPPHKEERFMVPAYPGLALAAALTVELLVAMLGKDLGTTVKRLFLMAFITLSCSRVTATVAYYSAPFKIYERVNESVVELEKAGLMQGEAPYNLCVGKEWYRFPSHFFVDSRLLRVRLIKSGFSGQLPRMFEEGVPRMVATGMVHSDVNDLNKEELSRYVRMTECDFVVDMDLEDQKEDRISQNRAWELVLEHPFLNANKTPMLQRALFFPTKKWTDKLVFAQYGLWRKRPVENAY